MIGWTVIHRGPIVFLLTRPQTLHPSSGLRSTYCVPGTGWNYPTMHPLPGLSCYLLRGRQLELPLICTHLPGFISTYCVPSTSRNYPCLCINLQELRSTYCVPSTGWNYPRLCTHLQDSELPTVCPAVTGITPNSAPPTSGLRSYPLCARHWLELSLASVAAGTQAVSCVSLAPADPSQGPCTL